MNYRINVNTKRLGKSRIGPGPYIYIHPPKGADQIKFFQFPTFKGSFRGFAVFLDDRIHKYTKFNVFLFFGSQSNLTSFCRGWGLPRLQILNYNEINR